MSETDTFGPRLRSERERRGISLETIALVTNVSVELWAGLERNDFSRWPAGIFARAFLRDYARAVGLDSADVVDEFCRLFPVGDRRANRIIRGQAELIGHSSEYRDDAVMVPGGADRRAASREARDRVRLRRLRLTPRVVAACVDTGTATFAAAGLAIVTPLSFWPALALTAIIYYGVSTAATGTTPGTRLIALLRQRRPALFAVHERRAHA